MEPSGSAAFCVQCGREGIPLTEPGLCQTCFLERTPVVTLPERLDIEVCVHCGSRRRGELWTAPQPETAEVVREAVIAAAELARGLSRPRPHVETATTDAHDKHWASTLTVTGSLEGFEARGEARTVVRIKGATCLRCSRRQGGYFEALIQLRATDREVAPDEIRAARQIASRMIDRIVAEGDAHAFVLRDEQIEGGLDIYFGTTNAGRMIGKAIAQELGGKTTEHAKLVGQKDGLDVFRITFAIRLPPYRRGDVVIFEEEPWLVQTIGVKNVTLRRPTDATVRSAERDRLERAGILPRAKAEEAVVVSRTDRELQVLDPRSYATVTVVRPADLPEEAATVEVVRWDDELVALPPARDDTAKKD